MQPNETLSAVQELALVALLAGKNATEAAQAAGVDRTTLWRWQSDFTFQAAHNRGRRELSAAMTARLSALAEKAAGTVEGAIDKGDAKTALAVIRGLGFLSGGPETIGSEDAAKLRRDHERKAMLDRLLG